MNYRGDFRLGKTVDFKFTTVDSSGVASALDSTSVIAWYTDNSTALSTAGLSVAIPFNSTTTGLNHVRVVAASTSGFATAKDYEVVILSGTAGSKSLAGYVVGGFSIENRSPVMPTVADRTLDVSATGEAGVDWANVGTSTTVVALSGTTIGTATALGTGAITAAVVADAAIDRAAFAPDTGLQSIRSNTAQGGAATSITLDAAASATDDFYNGASVLTTGGTGSGQFRIITAYVGATKVATVDSAWVTNPDNTTTFAIFPAAETAADVAAAVWDLTTTGHATAGTFGEQVKTDIDAILVDTNEIGAAGAGLTNINLPNQTMDIVGNITGNLSGSVGSVTGAVGSVTGLTAADVAAIKAKTDSLTFTQAGHVDANVQRINDVAITGDGSGTPFGV